MGQDEQLSGSGAYHLPALAEYLVAQGGGGLHIASALAVGAGLRQGPQEALPYALSGHLHQAQLGGVEYAGAGPVLLQGLLEGLKHLGPVLRPLHVYEVYDDYAPQVSEPHLAGNLPGGLQVGPQDGVLQVLLAHISAGVDIYDGHGLRLVYHYVAAGLQPHLALQGPGQLALYAVVLKYGLRGLVELYLGGQLGEELLGEFLGAEVVLLGVQHQVLHRGAHEVPYGPEHGVQVGVKEAGGPGALGLVLDALPEAEEELQVPPKLLLAGPLAGGAHYEAEALGPEGLHHLPEPLPFGLVGDSPGDPHVFQVGHEHQVAARQGYVGGNPGPLAAQGILGDLHHYLLPLPQELLYVQGVAAAALPGEVQTPKALVLKQGGILLHDIGPDVGHIKEGGLVQPYVHEGRAHSRQHPYHPALVDVASQVGTLTALHIHLCQRPCLQQGHPAFLGRYVYQYAVRHAPPWRAWAPPTASPFGPRGPASWPSTARSPGKTAPSGAPQALP